ncbi:hypothetical protein AB434_0996 [Heyndrickxia coagulans]|uniref:Uncharacterized protein n=1 Tax=Heyndrickxia coagulans TaxID=1398 RepID=A0AAN0W9V8_HEYCO|nr:hypothetical protein SB48_HM08orf00238 [Heyndrickxia coagulans]AKN53401.1 hypothetical protein AB434_0996 [Heyndrickxia coagulans]
MVWLLDDAKPFLCFIRLEERLFIMEKFAEKRKNVGLNLIDWKFVCVLVQYCSRILANRGVLAAAFWLM